MTELLQVTQADRDRVQEFHRAMLDKLMHAVKDKAAGKRFGEDEGDAGELVQAFARHRVAHSMAAPISATGVGEIAVDHGSANSHLFDDRIIVDGECVAFTDEPWSTRIAAGLAARPSTGESANGVR